MLATAENLRLVDALCRTDFASFIRKAFRTLAPNASLQINFHIYALAFYLELVRLGAITRLIINLPPRSLKSNRRLCSISRIRPRPGSEQTFDRGQL